MCSPLYSPETEAAFAVIDENQGLGIGAALLDDLVLVVPAGSLLAEPALPGCSATETAFRLKRLPDTPTKLS
jgi:hypothetical protein